MNKLFDYGLFIGSQNLSLYHNEGDMPWEYQEHDPAHFSKENLSIGGAYSKNASSHLSNWCIYADDLRVARGESSERGIVRAAEYRRHRSFLLENFKLKLEANLHPMSKSWRFHNHHRYCFPRKAQLRGWGEVVRMIIADEYGGDAYEFLEEVRNQAEDVAARIYEKLQDEDCTQGVNICDECGCYHDSDESRHKVNGEPICQSCADDNYTYSSCMDGYITNDSANPVYDSERAYNNGSADDYCTRRYGRNNFEEYDDVFFSDPDDMPFDHEDEDSSDSSVLCGYHNAKRDFREINATPEFAALGVELEVYADDRSRAVRNILDTHDDLICERDGSLDDYHGFEIVTKPYGPTEWATLAPALLQTLKDNKVVGYTAPLNYKYGIHVNIHRRHFSPLAEARIMMMLCDKKNGAFVRAIAQRESIYSAEIEMGVLRNPSVYDVTGGRRGLSELWDGEKYSRKMKSAGKYAPVNWQDSIAEFRIFNSTLNEVSFMKNLEFVWALCAWTKPQAATGSSTCHKDFIQWVASPQQRAQYPNLINYLSRKAFFTKGGNRIENTWLPLLNKPSDLDTSELLLAA